MNIKFKNVHSFRYRSLAFVLSLTVLLSGLVWYGVSQSNQQADAAGGSSVFYADATLYDYFYDNEGDNTVASQQKAGTYDPYTIFNTAISNAFNDSSPLIVPLYFGNFFDQHELQNATYNGYQKFWGFANNLGKDNESSGPTVPDDMVTQGLLKSGTGTADMDALPYFSRSFLENSGTGHIAYDAEFTGFKLYYSNTGYDTLDSQIRGQKFKWGQTVKIYHANSGVYVVTDGAANYSASSTPIYYENQFWANQPVKVELTVRVNRRDYTYTFSKDWAKQNLWVNDHYQDCWTLSNNSISTDKDSYWGVGSLAARGAVYSNLKFPFSKNTDGYWEFNSEDTAIKYEGGKIVAQPNTAKNSSGFEVGTKNLTSEGVVNKYGYFPFNTGTGTGYGYDITGESYNYGFGTKFEMDFVLSDDRKVINSKTGEPEDAKFTFSGDDDIWVFIDDKLILDMGGDHGKATGTINFATGVVSVGNSRTLGSYSRTAESLSSVLVPEQTHKYKMTIYYMERGMFESNCHITFNMAPVNNVYTISEETSFDNVNVGLQTATKVVASKDVFNYNIANQTNVSSSIAKANGSSYMYPSTPYVRRNLADGTYIGLGGTTGVAQTKHNFDPGNVTNDFVTVGDVDYLLTDLDYQRTETGGWSVPRSNGSSRVVGVTESNGDLHLLYGQAAEFDGQFLANSLMKVMPSDNMYTYSGWSESGSNSFTYGFSFSENANRKRSEYYTTTVDTVVKSADDEGTGEYLNVQEALDEYKTRATSGIRFGKQTASYSDPLLDAVEGTVTFKNTVKTGSVTISKKLEHPDENGETFTMQIGLTKLFGDESTDVDNYSGIKYTKYDTALGEEADTGKTTENLTTVGGKGQFTIEAGQSVKIDGIPVGTVVTVSEKDAGKHFKLKELKIDSGSDTNVTVSTDHAVTVTNERLTGELKLSKGLIGSSGATVPLTDYDKEFTFTVELTSNDGETIDFSKYPLEKDGELLRPTYSKTTIDNDTATFDVQVSKNNSVTISGIPYGATYTVTEAESPGWKQTAVQCGQSGGEGSTNTDVFEYNRGRVIITNQKQVGTLTIKKALDYSSGAEVESTDDTTQFKIEVTLTSSDSSIDWETLGRELLRLNDGWGMEYRGGTDGLVTLTNVRITAGDVPSAQIKGIPYGVTYTVKELEVPTGWEYTQTEITQDGSSAITNTENNASDTFDHEKENVVVTNRKKVAYLTIEKYIDQLYYGKDDNAHDFPAGSSGVTSPLKGNKELDPFGYLNYTSAEQDFVFKIEKYEITGYENSDCLSTSYVVLKFDKDSERNEKGYGIDSITPATGSQLVPSGGAYKYKQSTTVKVDPGYLYKVSEVTTGISWRYELAALGIQATMSVNGYQLGYSYPSKYVSVGYGEKADFSEIPVARFFNNRTTASQKIESDMSSIKNTLTIK